MKWKQKLLNNQVGTISDGFHNARYMTMTACVLGANNKSMCRLAIIKESQKHQLTIFLEPNSRYHQTKKAV